MAESTLTAIIRYFGYPTPAEFRKEWMELTKEDQMQIREGIGNGSMTY